MPKPVSWIGVWSSERQLFSSACATRVSSLLGLESARPLSLNKLWRHRDALENALCRRQRALFATTSTLVFVNLTNVHYHGAGGGGLRSQHCRNDCPLVTLGLSHDESGFKLRNEVLTGNIAGALEKLCVPRLRGQAAAALPTVTTDAGLSIAENVAWLRARGYDWTKVQRGRGGKAGQRRGRQGQARR